MQDLCCSIYYSSIRKCRARDCRVYQAVLKELVPGSSGVGGGGRTRCPFSTLCSEIMHLIDMSGKV